MIQMQSKLEVADNSGAKVVRCFKVLGGSKRMIAGLGDIIVVSIQHAIPGGKVKKGEVKKSRYRANQNPGSPGGWNLYSL